MALENLKSAFSDTERFESTKEKTIQEPITPEKKTMPISPDAKPFGTIDLTSMKSQFSVLEEPQKVDFFDNKNAEGFTPNATNKEDSLYIGDTSVYRIENEPQAVNFSKD